MDRQVGPCIGPQDTLILGLSTEKESAAGVFHRGRYYCGACLLFRQVNQDDEAAMTAKEMAKSRLEHCLQSTSWQSDTH